MRRSPGIAVFLLFAAITQAQAQSPETGQSAFTGFLFGDVTYVVTDRERPEGFLIGQLVGHGNAHLSDRLLFFGEISATARESGYALEVERAILRYDFADQFKLSVGRYHTPVSYWNVAYHHGLWLQTSVARPELIQIGGLLIPVHFVGAMAEGRFAGSGGSVSYDVGVGNGRAAALGRAGDAGDVNPSRALVATLRVRPALLRSLQLGGGIYLDRIATELDGPVDERTLTAHVVWDQGAPELIAEYVNVRHENAAAVQTESSEGWYLHAALRLPGSLAALKPYARLERIDVDGALLEPLVPDYRAAVAGLRWDFETLATLKAELRSESFAGDDRQASLFLQAAFVIPSFQAF